MHYVFGSTRLVNFWISEINLFDAHPRCSRVHLISLDNNYSKGMVSLHQRFRFWGKYPQFCNSKHYYTKFGSEYIPYYNEPVAI